VWPACSRIRASASPNAAWRPDAAVSGPVGLAETNSSTTFSGCSGDPMPNASPASSRASSAPMNQSWARKTLRKPGPATSTRSTRAPSRPDSSPASRSAIWRGGAPSAGASSIAALVE
jgi:hypothetical protein